jgi:uncharacterized membrane protein YphA (DoxX/SURF4 family)
MNIWVSRFLSGAGFATLGAAGLAHRASSVPRDGFRGHPLAGPEGGLAVEVVGWLGVCSGLLVLLGLFFMTRAVHHGITTGAIQAQIVEWMPEKKAPSESEEEDQDEA